MIGEIFVKILQRLVQAFSESSQMETLRNPMPMGSLAQRQASMNITENRVITRMFSKQNGNRKITSGSQWSTDFALRCQFPIDGILPLNRTANNKSAYTGRWISDKPSIQPEIIQHHPTNQRMGWFKSRSDDFFFIAYKEIKEPS